MTTLCKHCHKEIRETTMAEKTLFRRKYIHKNDSFTCCAVYAEPAEEEHP
jgi:hypothetical protein